MNIPEYDLISAYDLTDAEIEQYYMEFMDHMEPCHVLFQFRSMSVSEWKKLHMEEKHTFHVAFLHNGDLTGIGRITPELREPQAGEMGYGIRPSARGKGMGAVMARMIGEYAAEKHGMAGVTACVSIHNEASLRTLERAGYKYTGKWYDRGDEDAGGYGIYTEMIYRKNE